MTKLNQLGLLFETILEFRNQLCNFLLDSAWLKIIFGDDLPARAEATHRRRRWRRWLCRPLIVSYIPVVRSFEKAGVFWKVDKRWISSLLGNLLFWPPGFSQSNTFFWLASSNGYSGGFREGGLLGNSPWPLAYFSKEVPRAFAR